MHFAAAAAAAALAVAPVQGSVFGPVVAVKGGTFTITTSLSPSGKSLVTVGSAKITEQATAPRSALKAGACVTATGTKNSKGIVAAQRISVSAPVKGQCGGFVGRRSGPPRTGVGPPRTGTVPRTGTTPRTQPPGGFSRSANFGFASGSIVTASGSTLTVKGRAFGSTKATTTTVTVSSKTALDETRTVKASAIKLAMCAFVRGTSPDKGKTVKATDIALTPETKGACTGTRRPGS
ncbi:MAG: hypothetical protein ACRDL2_01795 [Gaiellaceae bacterium]